MAYDSIEELPTQVRLSLQPDDQECWMKAYNKALSDGQSVEESKKTAWHSVAENPSSFSYEIVASVECIDSDGEVVDIESIKNHLDDMIDRGGISQEEHGNYTISTVWDWEEYTDPDTNLPGVVVYGNLFGGDKIYDEARQDFINGMNKMSIGGDASFEGYQCDEKGCYIKRNVEQLAEISLCNVPANPMSKLLWYNEKAIAKSKKSMQEGEIRLKIKTVKAHPSCPLCDVRKKIQHKGMTYSKIHKDGVYVETTNPELLKKIVKENNFVLSGFVKKHLPIVKNDYYVIDTYDRMIERAFKKLYKNGNIDRYGYCQKSMSEQMFKYLYGINLIKKTSKGYRLINKADGGITSNSSGAVNPTYSDKDEIDKDLPSEYFAYRLNMKMYDENGLNSKTAHKLYNNERKADAGMRYYTGIGWKDAKIEAIHLKSLETPFKDEDYNRLIID